MHARLLHNRCINDIVYKQRLYNKKLNNLFLVQLTLTMTFKNQSHIQNMMIEICGRFTEYEIFKSW